MPSTLQEINLKGFKSVRDLSLKLTPINILIGANGAGKSNFLAFFRLLNALVEERLQDYVRAGGGADALLYNGRKTTDAIVARLEFGVNLYEARLAPDSSDSLYFADETAYVWDRSKYPRPYNWSLGGSHKETRLFASNSAVARHVREAAKNWRLYHFHDTSASAAVKQTVSVDDNERLRADAGNLAPFLLLLREQHLENYRQIIDVIRLAAPYFQDFALRPNPLSPGRIRLEWRQRNVEALFGPNDLSDGTLRFICLATALLQPQAPSTILIDEPELGLHPYAITLLAGLIRSASRRMQVIASTQSVPLVNQFTPDDAVIVERHDEQSTFRRVDVEELGSWLDDYGLGDLWEKNVIGGRPTIA